MWVGSDPEKIRGGTKRSRNQVSGFQKTKAMNENRFRVGLRRSSASAIGWCRFSFALWI